MGNEKCKDRWIPCAERMPEESDTYLVTYKFHWGNEVDACNWIHGKWYDSEGIAEHIVAWMPLPKPWKGE